MVKQLSSKTNLAILSQKIGITTADLSEILNGTSAKFKPSFRYNEPVVQKEKLVQVVNKKSTAEKIRETDDISDLWNLLYGLSYSEPEFIICYDKLSEQIKKETRETEDIDELTTIIGFTPPGSPEEDEINKKITQTEIKEIDEENDFYELINKYDENSLSLSSKKHLFKKILKIATTPEESYKLIDETFSNDSLEYYMAMERHHEIVTLAISSMKSTDDSDDIAQYLLEGTDEQILLANKIVKVSKTADDIISRKDDFTSGSEAEEILAIGAIEKFTDYKNDVDELNDMIEEWNNGSRIQRIAIAKKRSLRIHYLSSVTNVEEMIELIEGFDNGDPEKKKLEEKIILLTNDLDELNEFINEDNKHFKLLAKEKLDNLILEKIKSRTNSEEDYDDYLEEESNGKDLLDIKHIELCKSQSEADDTADLLRNNSYALYLLAKKFDYHNGIYSTSGIAIPQVDQNEKDAEQAIINTEIKNKIRWASDFETAINLYNSLPEGSENKALAYEKALELLTSRIKYSNNENELLGFLKSFPKRTEGWSKIIQKLAEYYPKPWYMFW
jgi:hypothetical protein